MYITHIHTYIHSQTQSVLIIHGAHIQRHILASTIGNLKLVPTELLFPSDSVLSKGIHVEQLIAHDPS